MTRWSASGQSQDVARASSRETRYYPTTYSGSFAPHVRLIAMSWLGACPQAAIRRPERELNRSRCRLPSSRRRSVDGHLPSPPSAPGALDELRVYLPLQSGQMLALNRETGAHRVVDRDIDRHVAACRPRWHRLCCRDRRTSCRGRRHRQPTAGNEPRLGVVDSAVPCRVADPASRSRTAARGAHVGRLESGGGALGALAPRRSPMTSG